MMEKNERIQQIISEVIAIIRSHISEEKNPKLYLFGSRVYDGEAQYRDIDLALSVENLSFETYRKIRREIENIRTLYTVDLAHLQRTDSKFRDIILSTAKKIYG